MPDPQPDQTEPSVWKRRWSRFVRHPASLLVWFVMLLSIVQEQYPFSHFPMYSGFERNTWYLYFKTADGEPIQTKRAFRNTVARCKKTYGKMRDEYLKETGKLYSDLTDADHEIIGTRLITTLKTNAPAKVKKKPDLANVFDGPVTLVRVEIEFTEDDVFVTSERDIATY